MFLNLLRRLIVILLTNLIFCERQLIYKIDCLI